MPGNSSPNPKDFERLFEAHELALRIHARALLPTWDAVDEVMQTSSLIMWKKLDQLDDDAGFLPWGKCIIRFESQKYFRTKSRDQLVFDPDLLELLSKHDEESDTPFFNDKDSSVMLCLDALGSVSRKLVLAPYQGHGHLTELAAASGRTRNSLYKQIRRIRGKLEQCVTQQMEGRI